MPSIETLIWILKLAGIILPPLGLLLLIVGLHGRRVGDAPHCRKCKYNLTGVPSGRCPECGHDLTAPKATRIGQRRRRKAPLALGALLLLIAITGWSGEIYRRAKQIDPYTLYPYSMLLQETKAGGRPALAEIERRYQNGKLTASQNSQYVQLVLDLHNAPDRDKRLHPWLDLFHQMLKKGDVTLDEEDRFFQQIPRLEWKVRKRIHAGNPLPLEASLELLTYPDCWAQVDIKPEIAQLGDYVLSDNDILNVDRSSRFYPGIEDHVTNSKTRLRSKSITISEHLPPGQYDLYCEGYIRVNLLDWPPPVARTADIPFRLEETIEIFPPDVPVVQLINRPELESELRRIIKISNPTLCGRTNAGELQCNPGVMLGDAKAGETMPINVACELFISDGTEEQLLFEISCPQGRSCDVTRNLELPVFSKGTFNVILRPSLDAAARTLDFYEIWGGELIYESITTLEP